MEALQGMEGLGDAFRSGLRGKEQRKYVDPWDTFGAKSPAWAHAAWKGTPYLNRGTGVLVPGEQTLQDYGHEIGAVGGKGSGKTYLGGMRAARLIQKYPGSKYMIVANSYAQAYGSAGVKLVEICNKLGLEFIHRTEMVLDGIKHYNVYYFPKYDFYWCIVSFDNIALIEGTEWDGAWFEEIQDCPLQGVETAISRIRRGVGDSSVYFAGMPDDENHWMYSYFAENNIPLYEPPLRENEHNLPPSYMKRMRRYHGADFDRYVEGKRISLFRTPALRKMRWDVHVRSDDNSEVQSLGHLSQYHPGGKVYMCWDFIVYLVCVSAWQFKSVPMEVYGDEQRVCPECRSNLIYSEILGGWGCENHGLVLNPVMRTTGFKNKEILVQVNEWEMFGGSTEAMCDLILDEIPGHWGGGLVIGDSTGSKQSTVAPGQTDWSIIKAKFSKLNNFTVRPGVVSARKPASSKRERGQSKVSYSNPPVRDRVSVLDSYMIDEDGHPRIIFMPYSNYPSGGAAKSCAQAKWTGDGKIDDKPDKQPPTERAVARTHFFDGVGYLVYYLTGGKVDAEKDVEPIRYADRAILQRRMRFSGS